MSKFKLSEIQASAILEMRLQRLTGLERQKIEEEYLELIRKISEYKAILASPALQRKIIRDETKDLEKRFGDERRTEIQDAVGEFSVEDLIAEEDMVITISHQGYVKRLSVSMYRKQQRGGKGVIGIETKEDDFAEHLFIASTHDYIMFFSQRGKCFWVKVHEIPVGGKMAKGKPIINMVDIGKDDAVAAFVRVREFAADKYVVLATKQGTIKKTSLDAFSNPRKAGVNAIDIEGKVDDGLIGAAITDGNFEIVLATRQGMAIRFPEEKVRAMGRSAYGVKGIELDEGDYCIGMVAVKRDSTLLVVTENGYGKRTSIEDYRMTNRGGKGVINVKTTDRNGEVVAIMEVLDGDELILITKGGIAIRSAVKDIHVIGRNTQGVRLMSLSENDRVTDVARVVAEE